MNDEFLRGLLNTAMIGRVKAMKRLVAVLTGLGVLLICVTVWAQDKQLTEPGTRPGETVVEKLITLGTEYGLKVVGAILILILGRVAAGLGRKIVRKLLRKAKADESIVTFFGSLTRILILTFTVVATLAKFGIQTASFVAVLGAGAFAVGLALQGSLSNFASGVMTLIFRPYKVGDFIEGGGVGGTVKELRLFSTTLATPDGIKIIVPNSKIYTDVIKNYSANDTRRLDLVVGISYDSDIQRAQEILMNLMTGDERALSDPAPQVMVSELGDSSVNLTARCWARRENFWTLKFDLTRRAKEEFDKNDVEIPFPQRVVHLISEASES